MPQDPNMLKLFGRPVFSGRSDDFFGRPPDLGYLQDQVRPDFIPDEHGYDPSLNPQNLVKSGMPMEMAMQLQGVRAQLHQQAQQDRIRQDGQAAMRELRGVDFSSPKASNKLVEIFSKYPNARKNKDVLDHVDFFTRLKPQQESLDIETISDPILHNRAKKEAWDKLPKAEALRKVGAYEHNQKILSHAMENGLGEADLADALDPEAGVYDPYKVAQKIRLGKYDPTTETDPRMAHQAITEGWDKLTKPEATRKRAAAMLNLGIEDDAESMGVPAEELAPFKDKETGLYDVGKVKGHLRQYQPKIKTYPTAEIDKYTLKAQEERADATSDENKLALLQEKYGEPTRTKFSKEDWDWAYNQATNTPTKSEKVLEAIKEGLVGGKKPASQAPEKAHTISTKEEYEALPPGATFSWQGGKPVTKSSVVARADGGPVKPGDTVLVGERGPEILVPHPEIPTKKTRTLPPPTSGLRQFYKQNPYTPTAVQREAEKLLLNPRLPILHPQDFAAPIIVGANGPELIRPQVHATIIPHPQR